MDDFSTLNSDPSTPFSDLLTPYGPAFQSRCGLSASNIIRECARRFLHDTLAAHVIVSCRRVKPPAVFISATNTDYSAARQVYQFLTERGIDCFFSDESLLRVGERGYRAIVDKALVTHGADLQPDRMHSVGKGVS